MSDFLSSLCPSYTDFTQVPWTSQTFSCFCTCSSLCQQAFCYPLILHILWSQFKGYQRGLLELPLKNVSPFLTPALIPNYFPIIFTTICTVCVYSLFFCPPPSYTVNSERRPWWDFGYCCTLHTWHRFSYILVKEMNGRHVLLMLLCSLRLHPKELWWLLLN